MLKAGGDLWSKLGKLRGAPERFFADSKSPGVRAAGRLILPVLRTELARDLLEDPLEVARRYPAARELAALYEERAARRRRQALTRAGSPLVSIVIAAWNAERWVASSLRSLLDQTYSNLEIVVVDDASTDATVSVVENMARAAGNIRLLRNDTQRGAAASRNRGLSEAKGAYVTFQDADDVSHSERIERQLGALVGRPGSIMCVCNYVRVSPEGERVTINGSRFARCTLSMLFEREPVVSRLGYMLDLSVAEDTEYYERMRAVFGRRNTIWLWSVLYHARFAPNSLLFSQGTTELRDHEVEFTRSERANKILAEVTERIAKIEQKQLDPYVPLRGD